MAEIYKMGEHPVAFLPLQLNSFRTMSREDYLWRFRMPMEQLSIVFFLFFKIFWKKKRGIYYMTFFVSNSVTICMLTNGHRFILKVV